MSRLKSLLWCFILLAVAPVLAQSACPAIVEQALQNLDQICATTGRNQACYGNVALHAEPQPQAADFKFSEIGDIENVVDLLSLKLEPMNDAAGTWGVVLMNLQANLPDTLPGQNVKFLLFGDVEITNAAQTDLEQRPMQAFYLKTGVGDAPCAEAPDSGLMVQTPKGVGEVSFTVNGVDVAMGSTVLFRTTSDTRMRVVTLEGSAALKYQDKTVPVVKGTAAEVPAITEATAEDQGFTFEEMAPSAPAEEEDIEPEPFDMDEIEGLPFDAFDLEEIEPLTDEEYELLLDRIENDEPLCGFGSLPSCDRVISELGGEMCVLPEEATEDDDRPICDVAELYAEQGCIGDWDENAEMPDELADLPYCEEVYPDYYDDLEDGADDGNDDDGSYDAGEDDSSSDDSSDDSGSDDTGDDESSGDDGSSKDDSYDDSSSDNGGGDDGSTDPGTTDPGDGGGDDGSGGDTDPGDSGGDDGSGGGDDGSGGDDSCDGC